MSKIPFDLTKINAVVFDIDGVLSPATVTIGDDGIPRRMTNLRDGYAFVQAVKAGLHIALISGAAAPGLKERYQALGVTDIYLGAGRKTDVLRRWMAEKGISPESLAYVGDDIPDAQCMAMAALPVAPADAAPEILQLARYISPVKGGYGVARDILEEILRAKSQWPRTALASF